MNDRDQNRRDYDAVAARMEPGVALSWLTNEARSLASIAISMKRIADAMQPSGSIITDQALTAEDLAAIRGWWRERQEGGR